MPLSNGTISTVLDELVIRLRNLDWRQGERMLCELVLSEQLINSTTYIGFAPDNSLATDAEWNILRTKYDASGLVRMQGLLTNVKWTERSTNLYPGDGTRAFGTITYLDPTIPVGFNIFENDCYPEDYGWSPELSANQLLIQLSNWINGNFGATGTATVVDNVLTITINAVGIAGNSYITYSSNPDGAVTSGQFTGGTDPE